jgi:hypothetical protein
MVIIQQLKSSNIAATMSRTVTIDADGDLVFILFEPRPQPQKTKVKAKATSTLETDLSVEPAPLTNEVHFKVSSKHMMLASPVFKAMLQSNFKEGYELQATGHCQISLPDDHAEAFEVLTNLVHLNNSAVPLEVDLELLANLTILVDKYQLQRTTYLIKDLWCATSLGEWVEQTRLSVEDCSRLLEFVGSLTDLRI